MSFKTIAPIYGRDPVCAHLNVQEWHIFGFQTVWRGVNYRISALGGRLQVFDRQVPGKEPTAPFQNIFKFFEDIVP